MGLLDTGSLAFFYIRYPTGYQKPVPGKPDIRLLKNPDIRPAKYAARFLKTEARNFLIMDNANFEVYYSCLFRKTEFKFVAKT